MWKELEGFTWAGRHHGVSHYYQDRLIDEWLLRAQVYDGSEEEHVVR